ncbi:hypothetical protein [Rosistilla oblonga]|uniref:hypothetical protein n=1 Tax=Rosistilla oblonga TaxID=2527990 RepID=UPI003A97C18C
MRYTATEVGKVMGRTTGTIIRWARENEIGIWEEGEIQAKIVRESDIPKIAKHIGAEIPPGIIDHDNRHSVDYIVPEGYVTISQVRRTLRTASRVRQAIQELGLSKAAKIQTRRLLMGKRDVKALAKIHGLPNPFTEPHDTGSLSPSPAGFYTAKEIAKTAGIRHRRVVDLLRRYSQIVPDPTKKSRCLTTEKKFSEIAEQERMPDPFDGKAALPLDESGRPWTRYEEGSRRIFVALVHDGRAYDGEQVVLRWWCWEITPTDGYIVHAREYRSRKTCLDDALRRMGLTAKDLRVTTDPLDDIRLKAWNFRLSHDKTAKRLGISSRVARRFLYGWSVRRAAESAITESMHQLI